MEEKKEEPTKDEKYAEAELVSFSPIPVEKVEKKDEQKINVKFSDVIPALLSGQKVHKEEWGDKGYYGFMKDEQLCLHNPDGKFNTWILSAGDLSGCDWIIL